MFRLSRQFVALLLTIWLPLFSGNALAVSIAMQAGGDCCPDRVALAGASHARHSGAQHLHAQHEQQSHAAGMCDQHDGGPVQHGAACNHCGVCHLAASGYLAAAAVEMAAAQPPAQAFDAASTRFQSAIPALLDPPPLARV